MKQQRTNIISTVSGILGSASLSSRGARCWLGSFGFISQRFVHPKRLGWKRAVDILGRVRNELVAVREAEANYENDPKKAIKTNKRTEWKEIKIRTEGVNAVVSCTFPKSQALTVSASSRYRSRISAVTSSVLSASTSWMILTRSSSSTRWAR